MMASFFDSLVAIELRNGLQASLLSTESHGVMAFQARALERCQNVAFDYPTRPAAQVAIAPT